MHSASSAAERFPPISTAPSSSLHTIQAAFGAAVPPTMIDERPGIAQPQPEASCSDGLSPMAHMIAGAAAGIVEHVAMYPVDTIKTRMQALGHPGQRLHRSSVIQAIRAVVKREGIAGLYKGVGAVATGAGPAHALYFATYEYAKQAFGGNREGYRPVATGAAGVVATVVNDAVMTPVDVIKQRLQVAHSPYNGVLDCVRRVLHEEGAGALYRSYRTTLVMNVPYTAVNFSVYESGKTFLAVQQGEEEGLKVQLVAGGLAGGAAAAVTTPLDVVKTRLQTAGVHSPQRYLTGAVVPVMRHIVQEEGSQALWRGLKPRVLFHVPSAAVCWGTYESVKALLRRGGGAEDAHPA